MKYKARVKPKLMFKVGNTTILAYSIEQATQLYVDHLVSNNAPKN